MNRTKACGKNKAVIPTCSRLRVNSGQSEGILIYSRIRPSRLKF